jgi:hypothetical protein
MRRPDGGLYTAGSSSQPPGRRSSNYARTSERRKEYLASIQKSLSPSEYETGKADEGRELADNEATGRCEAELDASKSELKSKGGNWTRLGETLMTIENHRST